MIWIWCCHQVSDIFILLHLVNYIKQIYIPRNRDLLQLTDPIQHAEAQPYRLCENPHYETFP
jgi:hypothetical protein